MPSIAPYHQRQMATQTPMLSVSKLGFFVSILLVWVCCSVVVSEESYWEDESDIGRRDFPPGFVFGASSASYQIEGGVAEGGRKPSIWDNFTHEYPEKIKDGSNGDVAADSYHLYKADVQNLADMNMDAYRFSISWSRILPFGTPRKGVLNKEGVAYYNHLIDSILDKGMKPFVTIFHWDVPQALEEKYGGFRSERIVDDFREYADLCFRLFGDRVKHWITVNEPSSFCVSGYAKGKDAPGRCSPSLSPNCTGGNSGTEPYIVAHNLLLSHAAAVDVYRNFYKETQGGQIGLTLVTLWYIPLENTKPDKDARDRALDFQLGWFMDPVTYGDYPFIMKALVGERLPKFTPEQSRMLKDSYDFVGLNYYTTHYALDVPYVPNSEDPTYQTDSYTNNTGFRHGKPIGRQAASEWLFVYPPGIKHLLLYTKNKYNNPIIYITENGVDEYNNKSLPIEEALKDDDRITFHRRHLKNVQEAIRQGAQVNGYFVWSLLDNFEWASGYTVRFGLYFVDFDQMPRKRLPKKSAAWFADILKNTTKDSGPRALANNVAYGRIRIKGLKNYI